MSYAQRQAYFKGKECEALFRSLTGASESSPKQDRYEHIDCFLPDGRSVDVKAFRSGSTGKGRLIVEFVGTSGQSGWCSKESKVDLIAYELEERFLVVDKEQLRVLAQNKIFAQPSHTTRVWRKNKISSKEGLYKYCGRKTSHTGKPRHDVFTYINIEDVAEINHFYINK